MLLASSIHSRSSQTNSWVSRFKNGGRTLENFRALTSKQRTSAASLLIGLSILPIYLATLTSDYYWDGITFALQIETVAKGERGAELLFHQNHLLYNAIGYLLYQTSHAAGVTIRALDLLQITNALVATLGIVVFFRIAARQTENRYDAFVCTGALAFSSVWWKLSTDANAYMLSIVLLLVCASSLLSPKPRWLLPGLRLRARCLCTSSQCCSIRPQSSPS